VAGRSGQAARPTERAAVASFERTGQRYHPAVRAARRNNRLLERTPAMSSGVIYRLSFPQRLGIAAALVAAADFLLYDQPWGLSFVIFVAITGLAVAAAHPAMLARRRLPLEGALLFAAIAPLAEDVTPLSASISLIPLCLLALSISGRFDLLTSDPAGIGKALPAFLVAMPFRLLHDLFRWRRVANRLGRKGLRIAAVAVWIMPAVLGAVFLLLFGVANPVIDRWFSLLDIWALLERIEPIRVIFWGLVLAFVWAVLRPRLPYVLRRLKLIFRQPVPPASAPSAEDRPVASANLGELVFGRAAILRALILFNLMFAVETILDAAYLWGGVALPEGMSYAAYAHRGAYPLVVTALLAALFVLLALRPGSATSQDRVIRALVYIWVAQNILLVISSIFRLDLYVGIYALTYWRVAAFIWMGLVAMGLALIVVRIALGKSNRWLSSANLLALSATLYACCFVNFAALIANYNVEHSLEMTGQGVSLDTWYLRELGPAAFPAIDAFLAGRDTFGNEAFGYVARGRIADEERFRLGQQNWRAWTFRDWRLMRYLDE